MITEELITFLDRVWETQGPLLAQSYYRRWLQVDLGVHMQNMLEFMWYIANLVAKTFRFGLY